MLNNSFAAASSNSFLLGSSTIHSVDPKWAEAAFGGEFANLAIHGATPHELARVLEAIERSKPRLRTIVLGLDSKRWCSHEPPQTYHPKAVFPESLYDADRLDDFLTLFNFEMLESSFKQLSVDLKFNEPETAADGYRNELDELKWKPFKPGEDDCKLACEDKLALTGSGAQSAVNRPRSFPALRLLQEALASIPAKAKLIVAIMPAHVSTQPATAAARAELDLCKQGIAALVTSKGGDTIDFDIASQWTRNADNYWDASHFRTALGKDFVLRLKEAVERRRDAADGIYLYLARPGLATSER